jgi:hypothetical protein
MAEHPDISDWVKGGPAEGGDVVGIVEETSSRTVQSSSAQN